MKRSLSIYLFLSMVWLNPANAANEPALGSNLAGLLDYAREYNPELAAMHYEANAAQQRVEPASALPDPLLRMELRDITNKGMPDAPSLLPNQAGSTRYLVMQTIPFWGKRDLKKEMAEAEANQAQGRADATWTDLSAKVKTAYAQYYFTAQSEKLTRELLDLVSGLAETAQARYANGLAPQQDVIRARVEQTGMRNELVMLETEHHHAMARLNTLLRRPAATPLAEPEQLRALPATDKLQYAALETRLLNKNPQLFIEDSKVTGAEKNRAAVYKNRYPDFTLGVSPIQNRGRINEWELMVEFNLPLQQQTRRAQEREAAAMFNVAKASREATQNQALGDLAENLFALESALRIETLTRNNLLPQAQLTFESALAGYETGKVDFATLLDAQGQIRKAKLDTLKAQTEAQMRLADIEKLLGEEL
jgi:outer membrane protein TolC